MPRLNPLGREGDRTQRQRPETVPNGAELCAQKKGRWKPGGYKINKCPLPFHRRHMGPEGALTHRDTLVPSVTWAGQQRCCPSRWQLVRTPQATGSSPSFPILQRAWWIEVMATLPRADGKTNRSRRGPRHLLCTWFIPPNPRAAIPAAAWSCPMPLPTGASSHGAASPEVGWGKRGEPEHKATPLQPQPPPRGKRRGKSKAAQNWGSNTQEATR